MNVGKILFVDSLTVKKKTQMCIIIYTHAYTQTKTSNKSFLEGKTDNLPVALSEKLEF